MYGLDINFLNDRNIPDVPQAKSQIFDADSRRMIIIGAVIAVVLPAMAGGIWLYLQNRNGELNKQIADLDSQISRLEAEQKDLGNTKAKTQQIKEEAQALASVFSQIKPWSAILQDFRDRIPPGIQILSVKQSAPTNQTQPAPAAQPPGSKPVAASAPTSKVEITGLANSFNDINDFLLVLQKSNFFKSSETKIVKAELKKEGFEFKPLQFKNAPQTTIDPEAIPKFPPQVDFSVETVLNDISASDPQFLRELDRKGAAGLVTRIEELQRKGVLPKP